VADALDPDQAAAQHYTQLQRELLPFESVLLTPEALLGSSRSEAVRAAYSQGGFQNSPFDPEPDHLAPELAYLAWLCGAEADAHRDSQGTAVTQLRNLARDFIDAHLLRWLAPLCAALPDPGDGNPDRPLAFYGTYLALVRELVDDHRENLGGPRPTWELPDLPDLLDEPGTRIADIARFLAIPCHAGGFFTHRDLRQLGRHRQVPRGFGSRWQEIEVLLCTAAEMEQVEVVLRDLQAVVRRWENHYTAPFLAPWRNRTRHTLQLLERMIAAHRSREYPIGEDS
jgi:TorA maturation chaperone TorD